MSDSGGSLDPFDNLPVGNDNQDSGSSSSPPPSSDGQNPSPPDAGQNPSLPDTSSTASAPPPDGSSSPPSDSNAPPPSKSDSSSPSPPADSNSSPPSDSESSPPPPVSDSSTSPPPSGSDSSPPPPPPPPESNSSAPPPSEGSKSPSPPPPSNNPPSDSSPGETLPAPRASNDSPPPPKETPSPPSPENPGTPATENPSRPAPASRDPSPSTDGTPSTPSVSTPPASLTSGRVPELSPPSTHSGHSSSTPMHSSSTPSSKSSDSSSSATIAGVAVAGVFIIALVALFFVISRKKKRRAQDYYDPYGPPPNNFPVNTDGYYYGQPHSQQHSIGIPGHSQEYYGGKPPPPTSGMSSYGSHQGPDSGVLGGAQSCFTYEELMGITEGFSHQNVIGEGGFGAVYKGFLPDGKAVAVKQLKVGSGQGEREFRAEVEIISRVHHRHLVSLVGYCIAENQRLLVYEFVPNNNLEQHLHGEGPVMEWSKRLKIAVGAARGLAYLHDDCHPKIIHRDIKSANILLDDVFEAQVADFGLAKLSNDTHTHVSTRVMGTFGYMAPEYASSGKLTDRSDVFSFGVVLLELVTGRKPVDPSQPLGDESLVEWARPVIAHALESGDFSELVDPRLEKRYVESEMFRMAETAAACVRHSAPKRPRMVQVLRALDTEGDMPDISNGVKVGQSTIFQSGQHNSELQKFRMMAFGSDDSSEYEMYSGNLNSREMAPQRPPSSWKPGESGSVEFPSGESETRAMNPRRSERYQ